MFIQDEIFNFVRIKNEKISELTRDKFVVALDFDGVVTNPHELKARYINELGYNITPAQSGRYTCINLLKIPVKDYLEGGIRGYTENPSNLPLEKGFKKNFLRIKNLEKIAIFFVTSRFDYMLKHMENYMKFHKISADGIIHTQNKGKAKPLKMLNAKIFVEDSPKKSERILKEEPIFHEKCLIILYRNIANKLEANPSTSYIKETDNWEDLADLIIQEYNSFNP